MVDVSMSEFGDERKYLLSLLRKKFIAPVQVLN
jgi:hypothetical protein